MSKSARQRRSAIGNSRVIPAQAGIQFAEAATTNRQLGPGLRRGDGNFNVIPAQAGIQFAEAATTNRQLGPGLRRGDGNFNVIPAQAGIQVAGAHKAAAQDWAPASAGATTGVE